MNKQKLKKKMSESVLNIIYGVIAILVGVLFINSYGDITTKRSKGTFTYRLLLGGIAGIIIGLVLIAKEIF